jgi:hypothetical protein
MKFHTHAKKYFAIRTISNSKYVPDKTATVPLRRALHQGRGCVRSEAPHLRAAEAGRERRMCSQQRMQLQMGVQHGMLQGAPEAVPGVH